MLLFPTAVALLLSLAQGVTPSATEPESFQVERLPARATRAAAFVPMGWQQERIVTGDLNGDKRPDQVLMLVEKYLPSAPENTRQRALVVLLAEPSGQLRRVAASGKVLYCTGCHEAATGTDGTPTLSIRDGMLVVKHVSGNTEAMLDLTQRFRYEPTPDRMRLVSEDVVNSAVRTINTTVKHTDFLTGEQKTERVYQDPSGGARQLTSSATSKVAVTENFLEDVDNNKK